MVRDDPTTPSAVRLQKAIGITKDEAHSLRGLLKEVRSFGGQPSSLAVHKYGAEAARRLGFSWKTIGKHKGYIEGPTWKLLYSPCRWKLVE